MNKKIVIVGKGSSGKDFLLKEISNQGANVGIKYTTRPKREGEKDGDEYFFVSRTEFFFMRVFNMFMYTEKYNNWRYGLCDTSFDFNDAFICTPSSLKKLLRKRNISRDDLYIVYLNINHSTRRKRLSERKDSDSVDRRLSSDNRDFSDFYTFDEMITDPNFNAVELAKKLILRSRKNG